MVGLTNIAGFKNIDAYIEDKINRFSKEEKTFKTLFSYMFSERDNVLAEISDGYRIKKITYGECSDKILSLTGSFSNALNNVKKGSIVGLYASNSVEWIMSLWALLACGYSPLLLNAKLSDAILEETILEYDVKAVVSDGKTFSTNTKKISDIFSLEVDSLPQDEWGGEILFMSSGTTGKVKLCAYTAENFYYQICDSVSIIKASPMIKEHYEGELKNLALLPFYHVFGFIAVYLWFTFFSRTLVFMKDFRAETLLNTIRKHKVTHVFLVPLVWEKIYESALKKIKAMGDKTYKKFSKAEKISLSGGVVGNVIKKCALKSVRDGLFGDSIKFLITGGSSIDPKTIEFFNAIGYHMANGYGMTEIGITSVDVSTKAKSLIRRSIGKPLGCTEYKITDKGTLSIKGRARANCIYIGKDAFMTDYDAWFDTNDVAELIDDKFYLRGRYDDLIVLDNGENLNPEIVERLVKPSDASNVALILDGDGKCTLLVSVTITKTVAFLKDVLEKTKDLISKNKLDGEIKRVLLTTDDLILAGDFKLSRKKIATRLKNGEFNLFDPNRIVSREEEFSQIESLVKDCFLTVLGENVKVLPEDDFFTDLGGTSLDYFALIDEIVRQFGVDEKLLQESGATTVKKFAEIIGKK